MVFNSIQFTLFFSLFFIGYWFLFNKKTSWQNAFLLIGSYTFYAFADYRFLLFLIGVSLLNYVLGIQLAKENKYKRLFFFIGVLQGLSCLFLFKYLNFFIEMIAKFFALFNLQIHAQTLSILVPVGISFFTFRMLSYILDINSGKLKPTRNWIVFFNYVAFFPSLLSGPIDKAQLLVPQLEKLRIFNGTEASNGLRQFLWGLFKKVVVADGLVAFTTLYFDNYQDYGASTLILAAFLFTIQLYADFSGYSDMAIGISRVMGLNITKNFNYPFFAQNIADLWRRWHISLTSWLTEYVFTPLSITFRDWANFGLILAILINFFLVGLWHDSKLTYAVFGLLHGCYYIPLILSGKLNKRKKLAKDRSLPTLKEFGNMVLTFVLFMISMIVFKADDMTMALDYFQRLCSFTLFQLPEIPLSRILLVQSFFFIAVMLVVEWIQREKDHGLTLDNMQKPALRFAIYYALIFVIIRYGAWENNAFIYFKF